MAITTPAAFRAALPAACGRVPPGLLCLSDRRERGDGLRALHDRYVFHRARPVGRTGELSRRSPLERVQRGGTQHAPVYRGIDRRAVHDRTWARPLLPAQVPAQWSSALAVAP